MGGGGGNAVNRMIESAMDSVEFISINTDSQALNASKATYKLHIGGKLTKGKGAGGFPEKGQKAAEKAGTNCGSHQGCRYGFYHSRHGRRYRTETAPIVAEIAHEMGISP